MTGQRGNDRIELGTALAVHKVRSAEETMSQSSVAVPIPTQMSDAERAVRIDLAACYRLVALYGWDDLVFTHISARLPGPDHHFLINP